MNMKHRVRICIADSDGKKNSVMTSTRKNLPKKILRFLFGDESGVVILSPGKTVERIEICDLNGEDGNGQV